MSTQSFPPVEDRLAHDQVLGREDRDLAVGERHPAAGLGGRIVEGVVGEEEVDGGVVPHHPDLAIPLHQVGRAHLVDVDAERAEGTGHLLEAGAGTKTLTSMSIVARGSP